jgi:hypothetical protein
MIRARRTEPRLRAFDQQANGRRQPIPAFELAFELFPAIAGQRIELGGAAEIGFPPLGPNPCLLLEAVQRGVERPLPDGQDVAGQQPNAFRNSPPVQRLAGDGFENQQIQRALEQVRRLRQVTPRLSTIIPRLSTMLARLLVPAGEQGVAIELRAVQVHG